MTSIMTQMHLAHKMQAAINHKISAITHIINTTYQHVDVLNHALDTNLPEMPSPSNPILSAPDIATPHNSLVVNKSTNVMPSTQRQSEIDLLRQSAEVPVSTGVMPTVQRQSEIDLLRQSTQMPVSTGVMPSTQRQSEIDLLRQSTQTPVPTGVMPSTQRQSEIDLLRQSAEMPVSTGVMPSVQRQSEIDLLRQSATTQQRVAIDRMGYHIPEELGASGNSADSSVTTSTQELQYLRGMGQSEAINQFTTAQIKVDMTNHNNVTSDFDIDNMIHSLAIGVNEAMEKAAEGVHH